MANEKRLIGADALMEEIEFEYDLNYGEILIDPRKFADMVENAPTVDAVEVVQCKNCKHYDGKWHCWRNYKPGMRGADMVDEEDFCSYGERRTK